MTRETAFEMAASNVRFGAGVTREVGADLKDLGARRVLLVTDPIVRDLPPVLIAMESLHENGGARADCQDCQDCQHCQNSIA